MQSCAVSKQEHQHAQCASQGHTATSLVRQYCDGMGVGAGYVHMGGICNFGHAVIGSLHAYVHGRRRYTCTDWEQPICNLSDMQAANYVYLGYCCKGWSSCLLSHHVMDLHHGIGALQHCQRAVALSCCLACWSWGLWSCLVGTRFRFSRHAYIDESKCCACIYAPDV
jgi:hypothetical protein